MSFLSDLKYRKPKTLGRRNMDKSSQLQSNPAERSIAQLGSERFSAVLEENIALFDEIFGKNMDLLVRRFQVQYQERTVSCGLLYFDGASSKDDINDILRSLMLQMDTSARSGLSLFDVLVSQCIPYSDVVKHEKLEDAVNWMLSGNALIFVDGFERCIGANTQAFKERSIQEPATEQVIQGSREGFIESLGTNVSLIRKRMRSKNLCVRLLQLGQQTNTNVVYCYNDGIANPELVSEVEKRLRQVDTDALYGAGYLEQFIEDNHYSPFPQVQNSERPDKVVAAMLEGRVAIIVDGSPFALIVPAVFSQFYQTPEDYDTRFLMASMVRGIRVVALLFSLVFPSIYVSLISFNPEMIPTKFAVAVAGGRAGVPFPSIAEIFGLELIMEILREATIRLPQQIGGALSIVGVLVIGQAAVQAGFASPITVVIVALTTIGSFATPAYNAAIALRMLRFPLMILAGMFGLYGVMVGLIFIVNHLNGLKSFGVPYLSPIVPANWDGLKDTVVRMPVWSMKRRPRHLQTKDPTRLGDSSGADTSNKGNPLSPADAAAKNNDQPIMSTSSPRPEGN